MNWPAVTTYSVTWWAEARNPLLMCSVVFMYLCGEGHEYGLRLRAIYSASGGLVWYERVASQTGIPAGDILIHAGDNFCSSKTYPQFRALTIGWVDYLNLSFFWFLAITSNHRVGGSDPFGYARLLINLGMTCIGLWSNFIQRRSWEFR